MPASSIILDPDLTFADLARRLEQSGWHAMAGRSAAPPLVPGEPEVASFRSADGTARLAYTFNPVVGLRVLAHDGPDAEASGARLGSSLPRLDDDRILDLLPAKDPRSVLLGIFAATERQLATALPTLADLATHPDPTIVQAAMRARRALLRANRSDPEISGFDHIADLSDRRQALRRLSTEGQPGLETALRSALSDPDLEMRAGAVLLAARFRFTLLLPEVAQAELAVGRAPLPDRDRRLLEALRRASLSSLRGQLPPADRGSPRADIKTHLWRCVLGWPVAVPSDILLTTIALTMALDLPPAPQDSPLGPPSAGVYRLAPLSVGFRWVGPVAHWLGHDEATPVATPVRQWTPATATLVAEEPLTGADAAALGLGDPAPAEAPARLTADQAASALAGLTTLAGVQVTMPSADLLEAALRGPDGRRHPWGFEAAARKPDATSAWGCRWAGGAGEWTADRTAEGLPVIAGTDRRARPSLRIAASHDPADRFLLRPAIPLPID